MRRATHSEIGHLARLGVGTARDFFRRFVEEDEVAVRVDDVDGHRVRGSVANSRVMTRPFGFRSLMAAGELWRGQEPPRLRRSFC